MDDGFARADDESLIASLVRDFVGTDAARCGEAHARLSAMGGFTRPEIRAALERALHAPEPAVPSPVLPPGPAAPLQLPSPRERRLVGTFELGDCLGRGGFGFVYRARDLAQNAPESLCVKLSHTVHAGSRAITRLATPDIVTSRGVGPERVLADGLLERALRFHLGEVNGEVAARVVEAESAMLREIDCDLFPEIYATGFTDETAYYAMEHVRAPDLRRCLVTGARDLDVRRLFRRLLREMAALKDRRSDFFHGDLKPENILVTPTRLRLVDPAFRGGPEDPLTSTLSVPYNPLGLTGEAADTMALALTMLEILTGEQPLIGRTQIARTADTFDPVSALPLDVYAKYASIDPLVARLVRFVTHPPSYAELADALRR